MSAVNTQLPNDLEALKKIIEQQANRIAALEESLRLQKLKKFGASSEKSPDQHDMFNEAELSVVVEAYLAEDEVEPAHTESKTPKAKPGRKPLPAELPRVRIEHDLSEPEKQCPCGHERTEIGETTSEQLDIIPAQIRVLVNVRKKYACPACEDGVKTAPLPPQPIPKSNASPGLLAHIATGKYQDALPLYRQEAVLNRSGIEIPRNTLASWMIKAGELIQPLLNLLEDKMLAYPVLHCDETSVQVLKEPDKEATSKSYMWVRVGGPPTQPVRLFHYADSRRGEVACQLLAGYEGYLQTDDYAGYNAVGAAGIITQLGCWAHVRRKFIDAQKATASKNKKVGKADMAVSLISKLYAIEKKIKAESTEIRYQTRQQEAVPQLQKIRAWLDNTLYSTLPKGLLGKALAYLDKNWDKLTVYTEDGRLAIDNNPAENAIRPFVVGRKNWLFSVTVPGAKSSANLYSLIETAKANQLEPYQYLRHIFGQLPKAKNIDQIEALLPWNVTLQDVVN
ncbi:IS66 family transposase [Amphritea sp. 2_MG-2023]|uniref:IS66 family transposase n=1 Tax=Amphritea TaxID=515417 RepID=UPI001C07B58E|nr:MULTISPECIES: IS66 family transposase [Amphritea]MBU2965231.1 IS66 family transposase [Amphritea atlantica]MDO6420840.1 IS66 family transposase [Amphritea sp. 2_MG-2023]